MALCQQAADREREELEWELRQQLARARALDEEVGKLRRALEAMVAKAAPQVSPKVAPPPRPAFRPALVRA
jgi:hypothetical protein